MAGLLFSRFGTFLLPAIHAEGTTFQKMVWDCLLEISYGEILAYGDIAKAVGH